MQKGDKNNFLTMIGDKFRENKTTKALFKCDCGTEKIIRVSSVKGGITKSCGCYNKKESAKRAKNRKYKNSVKHPLYQSFKRMQRVCFAKNAPDYEGCPICESWRNYDNFYEWAIQFWKEKYRLGRRIKDLGFNPENCYFRTLSDISKDNYDYSKVKQGHVEKYGKWYTCTEDYKNKALKTNLAKYGVEHHSNNEEVKSKKDATNIERYGGNPLADTDIKLKVKQTNIKRYGVEYPSQSSEIMDKVKLTMQKNGNMYVHDGKNTEELSNKIGISRSAMNARIRKYGIETAIKMTRGISSIEQVLISWLESQHIEYKQNQIILGKKPDFVIGNVIIECDGLYWHSDAINQDKKYHAKKRELYKSGGYKPLFFREDEINNKFDIVKSIILNSLNKSNRIYARKCEIRNVKKTDAKEFFNANHLMGRGKGEAVGLYYNGELVCCLQYKGKAELEIDRFCSKLNTNVIGSFTRLLKQLPNKDVKTFVDLRYGDGNYLTNFGFVFVRESLSFKWVKNDKTFHRLTFKGNTGYDNGCYKIWDCGQRLYKKPAC